MVMPNSFFEYFPQGHMQSSQAAYIYVASRPFPLATVLLVYWRRTSDIRDVDHSESTPMAPLAVKINNMVYQRISLGAGWLMAVTLG